MDVVTLITAYALNLEPKLMHALIRSNRVASHGRSQCRVGACLAPCQHFRPLSARRSRRALSAIASAWTDGVSMNRRSVTAVVFASCPNVRLAARQLTRLVERCNTTSKPDPSYCTIATGRGSSDRPDIGFADAVRQQSRRTTLRTLICRRTRISTQVTSPPTCSPTSQMLL